MKNIFLIGLSGSGKSYFAQALAQSQGIDYVDLDRLIVEGQGQEIEEIFKSQGEEGFRQLESQALKVLAETRLKKARTVVATGGGIVLREENRKTIEGLGPIVFLDRDPKNILSQVDLQDRPLLRNQPEKLYQMHKERLALYQAWADFILDANLAKDQVLALLVDVANLSQRHLRLAVLGDPIDHSLSPLIHKSILGGLVASIDYEKIKLEKGGLAKFLAKENADFHGFNLTMPHKTDIIKYLDKIEPKALEMKSVNTVLLKDGNYQGYSTDGAGIKMALARMGKGFKDAYVMIFGSGGAGAVAAYEAKLGGAYQVDIFSRGDKTYRPYEDLEARLSEFDSKDKILINASPLGMAGQEVLAIGFEFLDRLKDGGAILDMVYHPPKTPLLLQAEKKSLPACNGLDMLIGQAIEADNIFLDLKEGLRLSEQKAYAKAKEDLKK